MRGSVVNVTVPTNVTNKILNVYISILSNQLQNFFVSRYI